jgi:Lon protease-like protein
MKNIIHQQLNLPQEAPVMVLPGALLFPHSLLPLYIFEPRYRAMLAHCLERNRMFCVAMMKEGVGVAADDDDFHHVAGIGLIRACVGNEDGTSQLVLQGLARVRLTDFNHDEPFRIAQIRELPSKNAATVEADALGVKVLELCRALKVQEPDVPGMLSQHLAQLSDPEIIADIVAHNFVRDSALQQEILETLSVPDRLRILIDCLKTGAQ